MTKVAKMIPPTHPDDKAVAYGRAVAAGWDIVRGPSDHEGGWVMSAPDGTPPCPQPQGPVIRHARRSGWVPFVAMPLLCAALGFIAGLVSK